MKLFSKTDITKMKINSNENFKLEKIYKNYEIKIYDENIDPNKQYFLGVNVGNSKKASNSFILIDDNSKIITEFNTPLIDPSDLQILIDKYLSKYHINNITININDSGIGSILLMKFSIEKYFKKIFTQTEWYTLETKDTEESFCRDKCGFQETKENHRRLFNILCERVQNHIEEFQSLNLIEEIALLKVDRNDKVYIGESANLLKAYLIALYTKKEVCK